MSDTNVYKIENKKVKSIDFDVNISILDIYNIETYRDELRELAEKAEGDNCYSINQLLKQLAVLIDEEIRK